MCWNWKYVEIVFSVEKLTFWYQQIDILVPATVDTGNQHHHGPSATDNSNDQQAPHDGCIEKKRMTEKINNVIQQKFLFNRWPSRGRTRSQPFEFYWAVQRAASQCTCVTLLFLLLERQWWSDGLCKREIRHCSSSSSVRQNYQCLVDSKDDITLGFVVLDYCWKLLW